jgi:hypothetical protein
MNPNNRMITLNRLPSYMLPIPPRILRLREPTVLRTQTLNELLDRVRQPLVRSDLRDPASVAACRRDTQQSEEGDSRRLVLVRDIRVVAGCR